MEYSDGFVSKEHMELYRSASESADPSSVSALQICGSPKSPRSPKGQGKQASKGSPHKNDGHSHSPKGQEKQASKGSPRKNDGHPHSPKNPGKHTSKGSPRKNDRHSHSSGDGRPKKGGSGGKGTWGGLLDTDGSYHIDPKDPNYDSSEETIDIKGTNLADNMDEYKRKVTIIVAEYFATDDVVSTASELTELGMPAYNFYFVKKLVSMAMDRHDKEKEMAAVLLSALYADVIEPSQMYKGFRKLVESADDLIVDIPDTVDVLALFIARAVVDDILPPAFLTKLMPSLPKESKGLEVLRRAEKNYLSAPLHAEIVERRWGSSMNKTVDDVKAKINNLLIEYAVSVDKKEACRCMKDLNVPFFHHEIVKQALVMAMERQKSQGCLLNLLKEAAEEGFINTSQMSKGFNRVIDYIDDLSLDIPNARGNLQSLISKAASEGWLCASSLKSLSLESKKQPLEDCSATFFKRKAQSTIQEYFLSGDISEVCSCLDSENSAFLPELNAIFIKKVVTLAMDRKNREKEMASVLLSSLYFPPEDVVTGFVMLIESADDTALDNPIVIEDLAMFLARAVVDEVLAPQHLEEIGSQCLGQDSVGHKALQMAKSVLKARLSGERILRCWGGGGSSRPGWAVEDVKDKIGKLIEEYESGGDVREACRCIKELGMPFFHHEVVKKALVAVIEKKNRRLWSLLEVCFGSGLITMCQMNKGYGRVAESIDDLALDVPDARKEFEHYAEQAREAGWIDSSFSFSKGATC